MDTELLSATTATKSGSFITDTSADVVFRRGEEILGLPVLKDKTWNIESTITPAEAKAILLAMPPQRPLSAANVRYFKGMILAGRFVVTHQGIAFDRAGMLIDGMHRLTACVEADRAIAVQVTFNLSREFFHAMDRGKVRNAADDLVTAAIAGTSKEASVLATAARVLHQMDNGNTPWQTPHKYEFGMPEMEAVIDRHPHLSSCVSWAYKHQTRWRGIGMGVAAGLYTVFRERNYAKAEEFMEQVANGESLRHGDPAYAFREYKRSLGPNSGKYSRQNIMIVLVRCWNAFVEGRQLLRVSAHMKGEDTFPEISKGK